MSEVWTKFTWNLKETVLEMAFTEINFTTNPMCKNKSADLLKWVKYKLITSFTQIQSEALAVQNISLMQSSINHKFDVKYTLKRQEEAAWITKQTTW